ncbi:MAG TPA: hypothetical protein PLE77_15255 [Kiritimatiellia bacterium]|nr:hypothetical protein [Kiritimatiellia bacterium]
MNTHLCVGGPLDGQYRTMPYDISRFWAVMGSVEYQLVWSREHNRLVWWCAS